MLANLPVSHLLRLVNSASTAVLEIYEGNNSLGIEYKADSSPVTQADMAAHNIICSGLRDLFSDMKIVSEESVLTDATITPGEAYWIIDPIDGTKEFIAHNGQFAICLALIAEGVPVFGLMAAPAYNAVYYGGKNMGTYKSINGMAGVKLPKPQPKKCIYSSGSHQNTETKQFIDEKYSDYEIIQLGSQLKFAFLAEGNATAYPRLETTMKLWDIAAGHAIVEGVGGSVARPDGSAIDYYAPNFLAGDFVAKIGRI